MQSALKPRCIGCSNCVLACPFGVPKYDRRVRPDDEVRHVHRPHERGAQADVRVGVPERGAVVRHDRGVRRHPPRIAAARLPVRPPGGAHQGVHRRRRPRRRPARRRSAARPTSWLDDPFGLDDQVATDERRAGPRPSGLAARLPVRGRRPRTRSPAASSPATSCSAPGRWPPATSASPPGPSCARSTPASRGRSSPSPTSPVGDDLPVPLPDRRRPGRPAAPRRPRASSRSARSAPTSAASSTTRPSEDRWHCPCHEGNFEARTGRGDLRAADRGRSAASTSRSATTARSGRSAGRSEVPRVSVVQRGRARRRRWPST